MPTPTADLCDVHGDHLHVLAPVFRDYGGLGSFAGPVTTLKVHEDNALVRSVLETPGAARVLVVDGAGSVNTALVGGRLAKLAETNGWAGVVVWGAVRDAVELRACRVGIRALATNPRPPAKRGAGARDIPVTVAGVTIAPGDWLCADEDGIVVAARPLE